MKNVFRWIPILVGEHVADLPPPCSTCSTLSQVLQTSQHYTMPTNEPTPTYSGLPAIPYNFLCPNFVLFSVAHCCCFSILWLIFLFLNFNFSHQYWNDLSMSSFFCSFELVFYASESITTKVKVNSTVSMVS